MPCQAVTSAVGGFWYQVRMCGHEQLQGLYDATDDGLWSAGLGNSAEDSGDSACLPHTSQQ